MTRNATTQLGLETVGLAFDSLRENGLRSLLTVLGVVFGVMAVIATVAIVEGVFGVFTQQLESLGGGFVFAIPGNATAQKTVRIDARLTPDDALAVMRDARSVSLTTPFLGERREVRKSDRTTEAFVAPVNAAYSEIEGFFVEDGRFFSSIDVRTRAHIAVVGRGVVDALALSGVGDDIRIYGAAFRIVGVFEKRDGYNAMGQRYDDMIAVPYTAAPGGTTGTRGGLMLIKLDEEASDADAVAFAKEDIARALRKAHGLKSDEPDDFTLISQGEILKSISQITDVALWVVLAIVSVALLVGGIGIMNIMLVSVTERTREIGVRRALGATKSDILLQFLVEASALGALGGVLGTLLGVVTVWVIGHAIPGFPPPQVPLWAVALGLSFSSLTGLVFGIAPAARAARLDPIEALRYE